MCLMTSRVLGLRSVVELTSTSGGHTRRLRKSLGAFLSTGFVSWFDHYLDSRLHFFSNSCLCASGLARQVKASLCRVWLRLFTRIRKRILCGGLTQSIVCIDLIQIEWPSQARLVLSESRQVPRIDALRKDRRRNLWKQLFALARVPDWSVFPPCSPFDARTHGGVGCLRLGETHTPPEWKTNLLWCRPH